MSILKPKVIFVTGIYPLFKGGAEYQMRLIADLLRDQFEIVFIYLGDIPGKPVPHTYSEEIDGYKVYFIQSYSKVDSLCFRYIYSRRIYKILRIENPDFVYQRVLKFASYYIASFQKALGYKHFIHIADLFTISFKRRTIRDRINFYFFKRTLNHSPIFIVQTAEQGKILNAHGATPSLQIYNMHPVPSFNVAQIAQRKAQNSVYHVVWVANIKLIKRLELFVDIASYYQNEPEFRFDIIGNVQESSYAHPILKRIEKLTNVQHHLDKDNAFVNQFILEHANVVVNTSTSEGLSNVFIQSWLRGVPVVSLNSNPDGLFDKYEEFGLYCADSMDVLESSIRKIVFNINYTENAMRCHEVAKALFSLQNINKIKELLTE